MSLWTAGEVLAATGGRAVGVGRAGFGSVSIDSREVEPGALFVAIKGERFDGHDFVSAALAAGAAAALVSESRAAALPQRELIIVPDALGGLRDLAAAARARSRARIVAITGSAGKTTTKEMIRHVLAATGRTHASIRSFNNHWGVPLMLARLPQDASFGVFELGMNHPGEIEPLSRLVRPHVVVITTVAAAHLEFFESVADIARAKAEIFAGIEPGGVAVLNADHDHLGVLLRQAERARVARVVTCGARPGADWRIEHEEPIPGGMRATVRHGAEAYDLKLTVEGRHMVANAVAAVACAGACGVPLHEALAAIEAFEAPEGRGAVTSLGPTDNPLRLIDQSYNANSASMEAALDVFARQTARGRKVLVLGDMLELGTRAPALHAALRGPVLAAGADRIYLVGKDMQALADALGPSRVAALAPTVGEVRDAVLAGLAYGDTVMVKGSNGVGLAALVKAIRERFGA